MANEKKPKIKILKNGPYLVSGRIPLYEKTVTPKGKGYIYTDVKKYPDKENYTLCRCGKSKNPPFCDGTHIKEHFECNETASNNEYVSRAEIIEGPELSLYDDHRCALAMFCHRQSGDAWELAEESDIGNNKEEAIIAANECPSGRLTVRTKNGQFIEPECTAEIDILYDSERGVSGAIAVRGSIELEDYNGETYEMRNRYTLCRCGESINKPFCDGTHAAIGFKDK